MKDIFQGVLFFAALTLVAFRTEADTIEQALHQHFKAMPEFIFKHYESVLDSHAADYGEIKYLVMDFEELNLASHSVQPAVHKICQAVLTDISLLTELSVEGYDMVSVSFDQRHQYDCL